MAEQERTDAQIRYDQAMSTIRKQLTKAQGGDKAESLAQAAYRDMVREGTAEPIRRRYRNGRSMKQVR